MYFLWNLSLSFDCFKFTSNIIASFIRKYYLTPKFFTPAWADDLLLGSVAASLQDSSEYYGWSQQCCSLDDLNLSWLHIGHTRLTHAFILKREPQPQCLTCQTTCPVKHILIECRALAVISKRFFKVTSLTELFESVKIDDVLSFLWETGLYEKIWWIKTD